MTKFANESLSRGHADQKISVPSALRLYSCAFRSHTAPGNCCTTATTRPGDQTGRLSAAHDDAGAEIEIETESDAESDADRALRE